MALPYENATSGERAVKGMQKILRAFGCSSFGHMIDFANGELLVQFRYRDYPVSVKASVNGYAAAWLKKNPYSSRMRCTREQGEAHIPHHLPFGSSLSASLTCWFSRRLLV
jgi:hypothetical protein